MWEEVHILHVLIKIWYSAVSLGNFLGGKGECLCLIEFINILLFTEFLIFFSLIFISYELEILIFE